MIDEKPRIYIPPVTIAAQKDHRGFVELIAGKGVVITRCGKKYLVQKNGSQRRIE